MNKSLLFAIDYDDTLTAAPEFWSKIVKTGNVHGHKFIVVSCRKNTTENYELIQNNLNELEIGHMPIYLTDLKPKRPFLERRSIFVDIWIDDLPDSVENGR